MCDIILSISDGWVTAIATVVLTLFTGALAYLTFRIALYAKGTFEESKKSYESSIEELTKDRIIEIIYKQLDRIEIAIDKFEFIDRADIEYGGHTAFFYLDKNLRRYYSGSYDRESAKVKFSAAKEINEKNLYLLIPNNDQLYILAKRIYNAVGIVKVTLLNSGLDIHEINKLKQLLFDNIGFIDIKIFNAIKESYEEYNRLFSEDNNYVIDYGCLNMTSMFLRSIIKFEEVEFTTKNFESTKKELLQ